MVAYDYFSLLLINLASNCAYLFFKGGFIPSFWSISFIISSAVLLSGIESLFLSVFDYRSNIRKVLYISFLLFHSTILLLDYYLLIVFQLVCNQDVVDIISETSLQEATNFICTYLDVPAVLLIAASLSFFIFIVSKINHWLKSRQCCLLYYIISIIILIGIFDVGRSFYGFCKYRDGYSGPQYSATARIGHALLMLYNRIETINIIIENNSKVTAQANGENKINVVFIIGESFSKFHCSLYGYELNTYPLLENRQASRNLVAMNDVVCWGDKTHSNMRQIFSTSDGNDISTSPLFPVCFRKAGYHTALIDNMYFVGNAVTLLSNEELSKQMFEYRNDKEAKHDLGILQYAPTSDYPYLHIYHLMGQHYSYSSRYPEEFAFFDKEMYDSKYSESQRDVIAHYDNACLYNDYVVEQILQKYEEDDCIIVYFSDHGEEVYELGNFIGHGSAMSSRDIRYQLCVPFLIWMSDSFIGNHPELYKRITDSKEVPFQTSNISHFLMDVCNIQTSSFIPELSFINKDYKKDRPRTVMQNVDFDRYLESRKR